MHEITVLSKEGDLSMNNKPREITSLEQLHELLQNRPEQTETWLISKEIAKDVKIGSDKMRKMTVSEEKELASYLDASSKELHGPFYVGKDLICPECDRNLTFLDFVKTAIEIDGIIHNKKMITDILCGRSGSWITISGKNAERTVICSSCEHPITYLTHNYEAHEYKYA